MWATVRNLENRDIHEKRNTTVIILDKRPKTAMFGKVTGEDPPRSESWRRERLRGHLKGQRTCVLNVFVSLCFSCQLPCSLSPSCLCPHPKALRNIDVHGNHLRSWGNADSDVLGGVQSSFLPPTLRMCWIFPMSLHRTQLFLAICLRFCTANRLPGDNDAGPWDKLWVESDKLLVMWSFHHLNFI